MANTIQIKRSATTATPATLAIGEVAYSELSNNLFIGGTGNAVTKIGGASDVTKLAGIAAGAQVNTVDSVNGHVGVVTVTASDVGLGNVANTSDADKPVSTATQTALNLKADIANPTFTGTVSGITATMVGLGNVSNESKASLFTSPTFTGVVTAPTPGSGAQEVATKGYVDSVATGLNVKAAVITASTSAGTFATSFANGQTVGGVAVTTGDRILIKDQTTASENGIYTVNASGAPTRSTDADNSPVGEITTGMVTFVQTGTLAGTQWALTTTGTISIDVTSLIFVQFGGSIVYTAGTGLTLAGTVFAVDSSVLTTASTLDVTKFSNGTAAAFNGSAITALSASNISSGTLSDARLSAAVLLNTSTIDAGTF